MAQMSGFTYMIRLRQFIELFIEKMVSWPMGVVHDVRPLHARLQIRQYLLPVDAPLILTEYGLVGVVQIYLLNVDIFWIEAVLTDNIDILHFDEIICRFDLEVFALIMGIVSKIKGAGSLLWTALRVKVLRGFDVDVRGRIAWPNYADAGLSRQQVARLLLVLLLMLIRVLLLLNIRQILSQNVGGVNLLLTQIVVHYLVVEQQFVQLELSWRLRKL